MEGGVGCFTIRLDGAYAPANSHDVLKITVHEPIVYAPPGLPTWEHQRRARARLLNSVPK